LDGAKGEAFIFNPIKADFVDEEMIKLVGEARTGMKSPAPSGAKPPGSILRKASLIDAASSDLLALAQEALREGLAEALARFSEKCAEIALMAIPQPSSLISNIGLKASWGVEVTTHRVRSFQRRTVFRAKLAFPLLGAGEFLKTRGLMLEPCENAIDFSRRKTSGHEMFGRLHEVGLNPKQARVRLLCRRQKASFPGSAGSKSSAESAARPSGCVAPR
jgi:hypothetical protein